MRATGRSYVSEQDHQVTYVLHSEKEMSFELYEPQLINDTVAHDALATN
jgi:hypothetical protein